MKNIFKKTISILALVAVVFTSMPVYVFAADTTIPTVTISGIKSETIDPGSSITFKVYFDDETALSSIRLTNDMIITNGFTATKSISVTSSDVRTVTLSNIQGSGSGKSVTIAAGAAKDEAGNKSKAVTSRSFSIKAAKPADTTIPTVTLSKPSPSTVEAGGTVKYTVYFDDETAIKNINFNEDYVTKNGFSGNVSVSGSGDTRVVTITNVQGTTGSITVKAGAVVDTSNNKSRAVTSSSFTITKKQVTDTTIPTVTISKPNPSTVEVGGTVKYTVYFDDETKLGNINFNKDYVTKNGFSGDVSVSGSGDTYVVTLTNVQGTTGSITVKAGAAQDAAGNKTKAVTSSKFTITKKEVVDTTIPTVTISKPDPASVYEGGTVKYTVYFDDETKLEKVNFNKDYVTKNGFSGDVSVSGSGDTYVVTLTNVQGTTGSITVKAGAAQDAAGNKTKAVTSSKFTVLKKSEPVDNKDKIAPVVTIGKPNPSSVYAGGTVTYNVTFTDNIKVTDVNLIASKVKTVGFGANVSVKVNGLKSAVITLTNIKGNVGVHKYITIDSGVALDAQGNRSAKAVSPKFSIVKKVTIANTKPVVTKYTNNCIDDLSLLGDINKEITYFASWLRAEKYTATHVQENNYVAEDERMTYMVEYYNGSTAPAPNVKFDLTIPYKVDVEEINGNGKITKQTDTETVITWDIGTVPSYVASKHQGYCRLYVRVKFNENAKLEESSNISETFYTTLKTTAGGNNSYSYMRQLFIDTTEGKTGTYRKYLTTVDTTNQVRPDDEITRAEFAKLLADSGILDVKVGDTTYKTFKDADKIPAYARDAVSALAKTDIIQAFPDGTFKPDNPILMEDAMQMIAQASTYISDQKLSVYKAVFLYTDALTGKDKKLSDKKDYIMELMRQNVVVKYESNPDSYALRKQVVEMVNSLTFRGPYVETLPENTLKFADIRDDSTFFYNIVGASNSYTYTYDYRLWQQILEIK